MNDGLLRRLAIACILALVLVISAPTDLSAISSPAGYSTRRLDKKLLVSFSSSWALDEIILPTVNAELWGEGLECRAAMIETAGRQLISSTPAQSGHMRFHPEGLASDSLVITPLIVVKASQSGIDAGRITFTGVPAEIRAIENKIAELSGKVSLFHRENRCFSCHTALPLAMVYRSAAAKGLSIDQEMILEIGREISALQLGDGSFFFPLQPAYGRIMTTLCAGTIMAIISDFSSEFIFNLKKILPLIVEWGGKDGPTSSDFFLRPLFIGQPTAALFEANIISTIYFRSFAEPEAEPDDGLRLRLLELRKWADTLKSEPVHRRIVIMMGMPLLFQFSHEDNPRMVQELSNILTDEPEGSRRDIRAIALTLLSRIAPETSIKLQPSGRAQNLADEIWECLEKIGEINMAPNKN